MTDKSLSDALDTLYVAAQELTRTPVPTGPEAADAFGQVRRVEVELADWRRSLLSEQDGTVVGDMYQIVEDRKAARSYSVAPIMTDMMEHDATLDGYRVLNELLASKAAKLTFSWTNLQRLFARKGMTLRVANHEIEDDGDAEGPHVGQVWKSSYRVTGKEPQTHG